MVNLKGSKIYKFLKKIYFSFGYLLLKKVNIKNKKYYFSKWISKDGEQKLFVNYPLNNTSIVLDVGGYEGYFSDKIISLYNPHLIIFEPVKKYYNLLVKKYSINPKVKIYRYGLSDQDLKRNIYISKDGTSLIKKSNKVEKVALKDTSSVIKKFKSIDLMSVNVEGEEYKIIENLISTKLINRIKYLQVQFHDFVPNSKTLRRSLIKKILKTHKLRYSYPFVWESFEIKK